ncbi:hypothetical protein NDU88_003467 [Pleurodeles waltl]|uniref:Uncharacterized protein n=1 Tax=Pleurodeles waltl TaxID=8319 RepID=A0AAV7Q9V4_PLEWA|nr:hypothetical protein NDU88_003467 [Pleurodeles waltl]
MRTLSGHLFSNSQEEDVIEEMTRRWMTNWNDYGVRDIVHTMKQWDSLVQLHAATLMCNIIIQEYQDDGSSAPAGLVDLRKRASTRLPFGSGLHEYVVTLLVYWDRLWTCSPSIRASMFPMREVPPLARAGDG